MTNELRKIRKAVVASLGAAAAALGAGMLDGNVTSAEAIMATGAGLVFGFATWRIPNET